MAGFGWFFIGTAIGILHGVTLWQTFKALQPTKARELLLRLWGGAMLRCVVVALLLLWALKHSLGSGLWAFAGFFITRLAYCGVIALSIGSEEALPPQQEVNG